jgi:hypothetical protein
MVCLIVAVSLLSIGGFMHASRAQTLHQAGGPTATYPSSTDPHITTFNEPHLSWLPSATPNHRLILFLPGTNGAPHEFPFAEVGSALGFHVIFLMYPDTLAAQQACAQSADPSAYIKFRTEIIQGGNLSDLIHVDQADSIENRLCKLLQYLAKQQPKHGWNEFLDSTGANTNWRNIVVAGQSQGGGHAYVVGKLHEVARVIMFGAPKDYSHYFDRPAQGFDSNTKTPAERFFAFNHMQDTVGACNHDQQMRILQQIGLTRLGVADVDRAAGNFNHAHLLFTDIAVGPNPKMAHGSMLSPANAQQFQAVWQYMLTEPVE